MEYTVRTAEKEDFPRILRIYEDARAFMRTHGNPNQWGTVTPEADQLKADMADRALYVLENEGEIHGVFFFKIFDDPTYHVIERGSWHADRQYGVLHRVAGDGSGGILKAAVSFAEKKTDYLRIDTHAQNLPMQSAIARQGFSLCGIIYTEKGDPRLAYDRLK